MAIRHALLTVGTTAVDLLSSVPDRSDRSEIERSIVVTNEGTVAVMLGGPGLTTTDFGVTVAAGSSVSFDLTRGDVLWAISTTAGQSVRLLHVGV